MVKCSVEGCIDETTAHGYCQKHYLRWKKHGDPLHVGKPGPKPGAGRQPRASECQVEGCSRPVLARNWCVVHYDHWRRSGDPLANRRLQRGICAVDGCNKITESHGYCRDHAGRLRRHGDPLGGRLEPAHRHKTSKGYVMVLAPDHPNAQRNGYVPEHVLVMSEHLGRPLLKGEEVHHRFGERDDNRIERLELWTRSHPTGKRVSDAIAWANEILVLYGSDPSRY